MPAASEAGSAEKWLDRALAARPDLVGAARRPCSTARRASDPEAEARRLHAEDPDGFSALAQIASGGYYMNLKIRKRIRYPGQGKRPPFSDEAEYDLRDGLLDPVYARGAINTTPPAAARPGRAGGSALVLDRGQRREGGRPDRRRRRGRLRRGPAPRRGRLQGRLPGAGRLGERSRLPGRQGRVGARRRRAVQPEPERQAASRRLPARGLGLADHAGDVQRGRREHRALLRPVGAAAPAGLQAADAARARRRLADLLRGDEAVLRAHRPGDAHLGHGRATPTTRRGRRRSSRRSRSAPSVAARPRG